MSDNADIKDLAQSARKNLEKRERSEFARNEALRKSAARDARKIVNYIVREHHPVRIYQWGSVLHEGAFKEYSDIDIAMEGVLKAEAFFDILKMAEQLTAFPIDLVQLEKIEPEYAESIREQGKLVYECK